MVNLALTFLAILTFTEAFTRLKHRSEETQKLLDELVEAQKRIQAAGRGQAIEALAEGTVKNKVSAILEKTGVRDRT